MHLSTIHPLKTTTSCSVNHLFYNSNIFVYRFPLPCSLPVFFPNHYNNCSLTSITTTAPSLSNTTLSSSRFCVINAGVLYVYFSSFQQVDEEEYGGTWELTKEGFMTSFALFLVRTHLFNLCGSNVPGSISFVVSGHQPWS